MMAELIIFRTIKKKNRKTNIVSEKNRYFLDL